MEMKERYLYQVKESSGKGVTALGGRSVEQNQLRWVDMRTGMMSVASEESEYGWREPRKKARWGWIWKPYSWTQRRFFFSRCENSWVEKLSGSSVQNQLKRKAWRRGLREVTVGSEIWTKGETVHSQQDYSDLVLRSGCRSRSKIQAWRRQTHIPGFGELSFRRENRREITFKN